MDTEKVAESLQISLGGLEVVRLRRSDFVDQEGEYLGQSGLITSFVPGVTRPSTQTDGGVSGIGHALLSSIRQATLRRATALSTRHLRIEYSPLREDAGVIGGIWLGLENVFASK